MKPRKFNVSEFGYSTIQTFNGDTPHGQYTGGVYTPESQEQFFEELERALSFAPNHRAVYRMMGRTYTRVIDLHTAFTRLNLVGAFAKTDYLLKEGHADVELSKAINDTRTRLRRQMELTDGEMKKWYMHDFMHLCIFVAYIYRMDVPVRLRKMFPTEIKEHQSRRLAGEYMRVVVNSWDNEYIYADTADGDCSEVRICYAHGNAIYDYDRSYLRDLMYRGAQLNLLRPRADTDGTIYPELFVFEPDYLVDVSAVAHCFTHYAESPYVHLLRKLQPAACSQPILLGNFAGQMLDETIQDKAGTDRNYSESVRTFFNDNAMQLISAGVDKSFHTDAMQQKQNIDHAMRVQLPGAVKRYDAGNGVVEPSFFSEMLGLQGRMDYIQTDHGVIIEQKSGKGAFPYDNFIRPRHTEEHYVQILLYMLIFRYNFREVYEKNRRELFPFLLYSRYRESLLGVGFAPELVFRAMKLRNRIAWTEMMYTSEGGFRILENITAEKMNMKNVKGRLWEEWQKPQIDMLITPIHEADTLERDYFFRFMTFVANEHTLSKLGNKSKENSGFAAKWHDSLDDKLQAGNIYCRLTLISPTADTEGHVSIVTLRFDKPEANDMSNFRTGDIVILYPYDEGKEPDARKSMVFRCIIEDIGTDTLRLCLRHKQAGAKVFVRDKDRPWAVEHDFFESSMDSLYRGLHAFLRAPHSRRDLLMLRREPETDTRITLKGDYGQFNELALRVKQARDFFLIIGPPGTGKTSFGMLYTLKEELLEEASNVIVLSYTNRAVDEICSKLAADGIDFIRLGSRLNCAEAYRSHMLGTRVEGCGNIADVKEMIAASRVFVGTATALNGNMALLDMKQFSLAIIDEASQILEPHLIGLLSANHGTPSIRKFVMIGDHKQLPAVVQQSAEVSAVKEQSLRNILLTDCRLSLFERLLRRYHDRDDVRFMLSRQGRMHPDISHFSNLEFYGGRLLPVPLPHQNGVLPPTVDSSDGIVRLLRTRRIAFIATETPDDDNLDKVNTVEAEMIAATVVKIYEIEHEGFDADTTVGVIVPYRNQIATIRSCIARYSINALHDITIDTVERFQGSQRRYIIYGFTIRHYYQLRFLTDTTFEDVDGTVVDRKLNVAMTRAEEHLIMLGHAPLLAKNPVFSRLMDFMRKKNCFLEVGRKEYVAGKF